MVSKNLKSMSPIFRSIWDTSADFTKIVSVLFLYLNVIVLPMTEVISVSIYSIREPTQSRRLLQLFVCFAVYTPG